MGRSDRRGERAHVRGGERGAVPPMLAAVLAGLVGGATLGYAVQDWDVLDLVDEPPAVELRSDRIAALDCPEGNPVASLARGDRVLVIGRDAGRDWVEIRSPVDLADGAWIRAGLLAGDLAEIDLALLPVSDCERVPAPTTTTTAPPETTTSSSTTTSSTTTTTSTTTTLPATTTTASTLPTTTTSPNAGPVITGFTVGALLDLDGDGDVEVDPDRGYVHEAALVPDPTGDCPSLVRAEFVVADPDQPVVVTFQWSTGPGGLTASPTVTRGPGGRFTADFEFTAGSVPPGDAPRLPTFVVTATDRLGAATTLVVAPPEQTFRVFDSAVRPCEQELPPDG